MIAIPEIMMPILRDVRTEDERELLRDQIGELEAALFRSDPKATERILTSHLPKDLADAMRNVLNAPQFKGSPDAIRKFFQDLRDVVDKLPLLKLGIAFRPTEEMISRLHGWTQENIGLGVVLDISYDSSMLGGARIIFGGRYKEMTLAQIVTNVLVKEKTTVMEMIK